MTRRITFEITQYDDGTWQLFSQRLNAADLGAVKRYPAAKGMLDEIQRQLGITPAPADKPEPDLLRDFIALAEERDRQRKTDIAGLRTMLDAHSKLIARLEQRLRGVRGALACPNPMEKVA